MNGTLPAGFAKVAVEFVAGVALKGETLATRKASQNAIAAYARELPELLGGSADLAHSNLTTHPLTAPITRDPAGNTIFYGVREFGMTAIANGIALHGGFLPFVSTFLVFSDYARNAIRMSALMRQRVVHVFTHDFIGLGEDGPTHQPIEHVESLRLIPNLDVWRPCDAVETATAWRAALTRADGPTALVLSRQALPHQTRTGEQIEAIARGGYVLAEPERSPDRDHRRHRLRGEARARRRRAAHRRRLCRARRVDALRRSLRAAGRELAARRAAAASSGGRGRSRRDARLVALCRPQRRCDRHRPLRRVRAGRTALFRISASPPSVSPKRCAPPSRRRSSSLHPLIVT